MENTALGRSAGSTASVLLITCVTAVGGFLFGFDNGAISGSAGFIQERFGLGPGGLGWVTSSIIVGCIIGVVIAGRLSDAIGRKRVMLATAVVFVVGALGEAFAPSSELLVLARIIVGIGIGTETTIAPLYIAEVAPARIRGRLVSFNQLFNTIGNLVVFTVSAFVARSNGDAWNVDRGWRYTFGIGVAPAVLFFLLLFLVPESPRWLVRHGRRQDGLAVLRRINPTASQAQAQLAVIEESVAREGTGATVRDVLAPRFRKTLLIGFAVALFQQITGINAIFYYAPEVFTSAGLETNDAMSSTVLIGITLVAATLVSMWLIDKVGRRTLLLTGASAMTVLLACIGVVFREAHPSAPLLLALILGYVAFFAVSFGTVAYVIISEIFPTHVRGVAASIATFALWGGNYLVSQFFPVLVDGIGSSSTFFLFSAVSLLALVFTVRFVPETKNRSLEEVERELYGYRMPQEKEPARLS
ncbi:sugar porter family MFS transporter [Streptomyces odontomachi]|uniref:sugar porter family MFS transporter n=1 Tax=Streptomyces odontomachi TaxID=2944940 RepID=UPI00210B7A2E|nr:sugar porter family MFS transporter [Streptomyces sp. ODS25]